MPTAPASRRTFAVASLLALTFTGLSAAEDMSSFATGGYARGLHSTQLMHKIDANGDGMISREEWLNFQERIFTMLDKKKTGLVDAREFVSPGGGSVVSLATGGFARGLRTRDMMHKIDADADGTVSHDEFIAYQTKVFDMMDTSTTHKGLLGKSEFMFATGGATAR